MELKTNNHTIAWFLDQDRATRLDLEPPYQRNDMVWSPAYKKYFIDTILQNYPSPVIFLHVEISSTGEALYHVVDGKQRLTAIFEYLKGDFTITGGDVPNSYRGKVFAELDNNLKQEFYRYSIPVQEVHDANERDLRQAFDRLNRNVAKLSAQELRHAKFDGDFILEMERLADEPFWEDVGIATKANIKRMKLDEFVSEVFLLTVLGIQDGSQTKNLDKYYSDYDEGIPDKDLHMRKYRAMIRIIENLGTTFISSSRYKNLSDFYSLWAALLPYAGNPEGLDYQATKNALTDFERQYNAYLENPGPDPALNNPDIIAYYDSTRQGVNKDANRKKRAEVLSKSIRGL